MRNAVVLASMTVGLCFAATSSSALVDSDNSFALYLQGAFVDGDLQFGEFDTEVDVNADDVLGSLEAALFARYRHQNEAWAFVFDGQYAALGDSNQEDRIETDLDMDLYLFQVDGAYRFNEYTEAFLGVRYVRFESEVDLHFLGDGSLHRGGDASFWDPVIGVRTIRPMSDRWWLQAQFDIGGGANMDLTWQAMAHAGYEMGEDLSLWFGYRGLGMDFDDGGGRNRIDADIVLHGPEAGVAFHF
jgi:hypothetical protein